MSKEILVTGRGSSESEAVATTVVKADVLKCPYFVRVEDVKRTWVQTEVPDVLEAYYHVYVVYSDRKQDDD